MNDSASKQWLVRRNGSPIIIGGPYWSGQVKEMIERGELDFDDELCMENYYWLALHESEELKGLLGLAEIKHAKVFGADETDKEITAPDFEITPIEGTNTSLAKPVQKQTEPVPSPYSTQVQRVRASPENFTRGVALAGIDRGRIWLGILIITLIVSVLGVVWVLRTLPL